MLRAEGLASQGAGTADAPRQPARTHSRGSPEQAEKDDPQDHPWSRKQWPQAELRKFWPHLTLEEVNTNHTTVQGSNSIQWKVQCEILPKMFRHLTIRTSLPRQQLKGFKEVFDMLDTDSKGFITR